MGTGPNKLFESYIALRGLLNLRQVWGTGSGDGWKKDGRVCQSGYLKAVVLNLWGLQNKAVGH